jgi:hypothetical protein
MQSSRVQRGESTEFDEITTASFISLMMTTPGHIATPSWGTRNDLSTNDFFLYFGEDKKKVDVSA